METIILRKRICDFQNFGLKSHKQYNFDKIIMFDKIRDMYRLQKEAKEARKKLKNIHIEASQDGFTVVFDGEMEALSVAITDEAIAKAAQNKKEFEETILKCLNKALKKAQQVAAEEMKGVMGQIGLGGM